jgi:Fe-S-cluster-containing hydrogenase component 2
LPKKNEEPSVNIYDLLSDEVAEIKEEKKNRRAELLESIGVEDRFEDGSIKIDMRTCRGLECNLCVKSCPTNALYWRAGEIGIEEDLCVHCTACVLNCCVDNCIKVTRKRPDGKTETFSTPKEALEVNRLVAAQNTREKVKLRVKDSEECSISRY